MRTPTTGRVFRHHAVCCALFFLLAAAVGCGKNSIPPVAPLAFSTGSIPAGQVGAAYNAVLHATGGTAPYTWSVSSGTLPAGLALSGTTGAITGNPVATATTASFIVTVTDSGKPAQSLSERFTLTIAAPTLTFGTRSLPVATVGVPYTATLAASGGTSPYTFTLTSGTLPAGLSLAPSTGAISGTPTAAASSVPLGFTVTDSSVPAQTASGSATLTVNAGISLSVSPVRAGVTETQALSLTATTNDPAGVKWSCSGGSNCGSFSAATSQNGSAVKWTPPSSAGHYTLTATSVTDKTKTASASVGVTSLTGMLTWHNDVQRDGANAQEYALAPSTVTSSTFGKLFSCAVDGAIYAQPLWVAHVAVNGAQHNVVIVATQHDSLYAFDADGSTSPCTPLWHANLLDAAHGGTPGETTVPDMPGNALIGRGYYDIDPEIGVTGTPVIDPATGTVYVVSKSVIVSGPTFFQRLHAIDIATGNEKFSGPVRIAPTYPGIGDGSSTTTLNPEYENQRAGLALANGVVYIAWGSHEDAWPFYGWIAGYDASTLAQVNALNVEPNTGGGGMWMGGAAPALDQSGNLYVLTGNGTFDIRNSSGPTNDYGDSLLRLTSGLGISQYFTPTDQGDYIGNDDDFGSGGAAVLATLPATGSNPTHLLICGGKDGALYVINRDQLGGYGDSNAWQMLNLNNPIFASGAFWNSTYYIAPKGGALQAFTLSASTAKLTPASSTAITFAFPGAVPSISSMPDGSNGIAWVLDNSQYCTHQAPGCGPAVLHAFDATSLSNELWNSAQGSGNSAGYAVKFTVPTIANGKVYVGTRGNNAGDVDSSTSTPGELDVYGLLPN